MVAATDKDPTNRKYWTLIISTIFRLVWVLLAAVSLTYIYYDTSGLEKPDLYEWAFYVYEQLRGGFTLLSMLLEQVLPSIGWYIPIKETYYDWNYLVALYIGGDWVASYRVGFWKIPGVRKKFDCENPEHESVGGQFDTESGSCCWCRRLEKFHWLVAGVAVILSLFVPLLANYLPEQFSFLFAPAALLGIACYELIKLPLSAMHPIRVPRRGDRDSRRVYVEGYVFQPFGWMLGWYFYWYALGTVLSVAAAFFISMLWLGLESAYFLIVLFNVFVLILIARNTSNTLTKMFFLRELVQRNGRVLSKWESFSGSGSTLLSIRLITAISSAFLLVSLSVEIEGFFDELARILIGAS